MDESRLFTFIPIKHIFAAAALSLVTLQPSTRAETSPDPSKLPKELHAIC